MGKGQFIKLLANIRNQSREVKCPLSAKLTNELVGCLGKDKNFDDHLLGILKDTVRKGFKDSEEVFSFRGELKFWISISKYEPDYKRNKNSCIQNLKGDFKCLSKKAIRNYESYKERNKNFRLPIIKFELLHSEAFGELKYYPAYLVFLWSLEKVKIRVNKNKRGANRYSVLNEGFVFPYDEAVARGLTRKQFQRAVSLLLSHGFLDLKQKGGLLENPSIYMISERWRNFKTSDFDVNYFL